MLDKAKHESEIDFCNCLIADNMHYIYKFNTKVEFIDVVHNFCEYNSNDANNCISKKLDCKYHIDAMANGKWYDSKNNEKITTFKFDVKDVEDQNISTKNYTLNLNEVDFLEKTTDIHYLAFRHNDGISKKFSQYVVVDGNELCLNKKSFINKGTYFLVPLEEINKCINKFEITGDF